MDSIHGFVRVGIVGIVVWAVYFWLPLCFEILERYYVPHKKLYQLYQPYQPEHGLKPLNTWLIYETAKR